MAAVAGRAAASRFQLSLMSMVQVLVCGTESMTTQLNAHGAARKTCRSDTKAYPLQATPMPAIEPTDPPQTS
jgi:hypothetical protein